MTRKHILTLDMLNMSINLGLEDVQGVRVRYMKGRIPSGICGGWQNRGYITILITVCSHRSPEPVASSCSNGDWAAALLGFRRKLDSVD